MYFLRVFLFPKKRRFLTSCFMQLQTVKRDFVQFIFAQTCSLGLRMFQVSRPFLDGSARITCASPRERIEHYYRFGRMVSGITEVRA